MKTVYKLYNDYICENCLNSKVPEQHRGDAEQWTTQSIGEVDVPYGCIVCGEYFAITLTSSGIKHVINSLSIDKSELKKYTNTAHMYAEWAEDVKWYGIDDEDRQVVDDYLEWYYDYFKDDDNGADATLSDDEQQRLELVASRCIRAEHLTDRQMHTLSFTKWLIDNGRL